MGEKNWNPTHNNIIVTLNTDREEGQLKTNSEMLSEVQTVLAVGPIVNQFKVGDEVLIDIDKMTVQEKQEDGSYTLRVKVEPIEFNGKQCIFIGDRYVKAWR